jgi:signal transduction histidine kinase
VKLRARLVLTMLLVTVPAIVGLTWLAQSMRENALVESVYEATLARMESGGRERCERGLAIPERPRRRHRRRHRHHRGPRRERRVYDDAYRPMVPGEPALDPELAEALEGGDPVAARWIGARRVRIAMRMPWDGACAVVVIERGAGPLFHPATTVRALIWSLAVALLTALAALLAMGPFVRRMRRLAVAVRGQASGGYAGDVEVRGRDEIADLARAFNEASHEVRARLAEVSSRDRALTEFLQSTTHDVMVPLTVLQGHLIELARAFREGGPIVPAKLSGAIEESHYLGALLRNLSAAARLEAGEPMLTRHAFDLRALVERVVARHAPIARERGVSLGHAVPDAPLEIVADSTLAEQAIGNLVHNAIRYNREGGHVALVLEPESGDRFTLRVADDGPGIPPEELAHVSERRFRGGEARKRRPNGLGLGLHIVRDVAERHGWTLRFGSPPEGGLEVTLSGPLREGAASAARA